MDSPFIVIARLEQLLKYGSDQVLVKREELAYLLKCSKKLLLDEVTKK